MDVTNEDPYEFLTWTINRAIMSPAMGLDITQGWPYAPYHALITALPYVQHGLIFFMALAILTFILFGLRINLWQILMLAGLFSIPSLILMTGGIPLPTSIPMSKFAEYQVRLLPLISLLSIGLAYCGLQKFRRLPVIVVLLLMALFLGGYPQISLIVDEQKRNFLLNVVQISMMAYLFVFALYTRIQSIDHAEEA